MQGKYDSNIRYLEELFEKVKFLYFGLQSQTNTITIHESNFLNI